MSNFELIDDYLTNRLQEADRKAFEQQLETDASLKEDLAFQRQLVEGVKRARVAELKSMLSNVPVGGNSWSGGKTITAAVSAAVVITSLYLYMKDDAKTLTTSEAQTEDSANLPDAGSKETTSLTSEDLTVKESSDIQNPDGGKSAITKDKKVTKPVRKPDLNVLDPSAEFSDTEQVTSEVTPARSEISLSKMEVITGLVDKKHDFHYQFVQGKLMLYGPFDKSLYEILEIHGESHAVFLFYKENYYLLDETQTAITSLHPIRDGQLIKKLKEYRGQ